MHIGDYISLATLLAVLGLWGRLYLMNFQFGLMWHDYCERKGIPHSYNQMLRGHQRNVTEN